MATATLAKPGVNVFQSFQTTSPTINKPGLPASIVGVAKQVVEAVNDSGVLDTAAFLSLPARLAFPFVSAGYTGAESKTFSLSVNNGAAVTFSFPATPTDPTPAELKAYIDLQAIAGLVATVETSGSQSRLVLETTERGQFASLKVVGGTLLSLSPLFDSLGEGGLTFVGLDGYDNDRAASILLAEYPDPRSNLSELVVDFNTVRVFLDTAASFREVLKTQAFLRGGTTAVTVFDDGDGDNLSPYLDFASAHFTAGDAVATGTVDWNTLTYPADFGTNTLLLETDVAAVTVTFANPANAAAAAAAIDSALGGGGTAALDSSGFITITTATSGAAGYVRVLGGTISLATLGLTSGSLDQAYPSVAKLFGTANVATIPALSGNLSLSVNGGAAQLIDLTGLTTGLAIGTAINNHLGAGVASLASNVGLTDNVLLLSAPDSFGGSASSIEVLGTSTASVLTALGMSAGITEGNPHPVAVGDELWVDGIKQGVVTEIVSDTRLRLDTELLLTFTGARYFLNALGLSNSIASSTRPASELQVDADSGTVLVGLGIFRDTAGARTTAKNLGMYLGYTALRKDVTASGSAFSLLRIGTTTDLEAALAPIDTQNPLGLGMSVALLNAPGFEITGLGVDEDSATEPEGTVAGWTRALTYLESKDVYSIAAMTHSKPVGDLLDAHVTLMSNPENGLERVAFLNPLRPTHKSNTLVGSGAKGNAVAGTSVVDTGIANLPALVAAQGLGPGPYTIADNLFIELEQDTNKYLILAVSGSQVTVSAAASLAGNDDGFYYEGTGTAFATAIVDRPFSVAIRGALLTSLTDEAVAYADLARAYLNRRTVVMTPDKATMTIGGLEQVVEGYYATAAIAGMTAASGPSAPFTNVALAAITNVQGSNDRYGELQLKIMDGGGLWSLVREDDSTPVTTRHQLTSDMTSLETREYSIVKAVDFGAKTIRQALKNFIGRFNLTLGVQDSISTILDGMENFFVENNIFASFQVNGLSQDPAQPDHLIIDAQIGVLYPTNTINVTLVI